MVSIQYVLYRIYFSELPIIQNLICKQPITTYYPINILIIFKKYKINKLVELTLYAFMVLMIEGKN
jgi:hypothetical protein